MTTPHLSTYCFETDPLSSHIKRLNVNGFTIIKNSITYEEVSQLLVLVKYHHSLLSNVNYSGIPARDVRDKIVYNLPCKDLKFLKPVFSAQLEAILKIKLNDIYYRYLPQSSPNYFLSYYNARSSGAKLDLHIDSYIPSSGSYCWSMQVVVALEDMYPENGCTVVVPGSHISDKYTDRNSREVIDLELKAGDIAIWDSRLWHGTRENKTVGTRWALVATFSCWWVKPSMDFTRSLPQEFYLNLNSKEKSLLGFCSIPPKDEFSRINTKSGYDDIKPEVTSYW